MNTATNNKIQGDEQNTNDPIDEQQKPKLEQQKPKSTKNQIGQQKPRRQTAKSHV
jgi:hypothetical protein